MTIRRAMKRGSSPRLEHRGEVVDGRVGVAAAHRLDEGGDEVVVLVAAAVVDGAGACARRRRTCRSLERDALGAGRRRGELERRSSAARASPPARARRSRSTTSSGAARARAPRRRGARPRRARPRRAARARRPAQRESSAELTSKYGFSVVAPISVTRPLLDRRQQRVLLRLVEAVDLVEEEDRRAARCRRAGRAPAAITARTSATRRRHGRELLERGAGRLGDDPRERRLARRPGGP